MKNKMKWLGIIAFIAIIGVSMFSCDLNFDELNGDWDRGDIIVTFNDSDGRFTQINSNSGWFTLQNNGTVKIGDRKFRNLSSSGNSKWTGQELTYIGNSTSWESTTLTISGQILTTVTPAASPSTNTYTRR